MNRPVHVQNSLCFRTLPGLFEQTLFVQCTQLSSALLIVHVKYSEIFIYKKPPWEPTKRGPYTQAVCICRYSNNEYISLRIYKNGGCYNQVVFKHR